MRASSAAGGGKPFLGAQFPSGRNTVPSVSPLLSAFSLSAVALSLPRPRMAWRGFLFLVALGFEIGFFTFNCCSNKLMTLFAYLPKNLYSKYPLNTTKSYIIIRGVFGVGCLCSIYNSVHISYIWLCICSFYSSVYLPSVDVPSTFLST